MKPFCKQTISIINQCPYLYGTKVYYLVSTIVFFYFYSDDGSIRIKTEINVDDTVVYFSREY